MDSIREQIIQNIISKTGQIRISAGYQTDIGARVERALKNADPDKTPCSVVWPATETRDQEYGYTANSMLVRISGFVDHGEVNPSVVVERMLADLIENMLGVEWVIEFQNAGPVPMVVGTSIGNHEGTASGYIAEVEKTAGEWEDITAEGSLTLRRVQGEFMPPELIDDEPQIVERLDYGAYANYAESLGVTVIRDALLTTTNNLCKAIEYAGGGPEDYPGLGERKSGVSAHFNFIYEQINGDPYHQPS